MCWGHGGTRCARESTTTPASSNILARSAGVAAAGVGVRGRICWARISTTTPASGNILARSAGVAAAGVGVRGRICWAGYCVGGWV